MDIDATVKHNLDAITTMQAKNDAAIKAGDTCPKCGGGVNPTILARFGHCLACQRASWNR